MVGKVLILSGRMTLWQDGKERKRRLYTLVVLSHGNKREGLLS